MDQFPMTRLGYDKLRAELDHMEHVEMPAILERLAEARAEGDLRENAEYHGARESQGMLDAKMGQIRYKLQNARIIDPSALPKDEVVFGCTVKVLDLDYDDEDTYEIVGAGEDDPMENRILLTSPLAQGIVGKKVGDTVEIPVPRGTMKLKILEIKAAE